MPSPTCLPLELSILWLHLPLKADGVRAKRCALSSSVVLQIDAGRLYLLPRRFTLRLRSDRKKLEIEK